MLLREIKRRSHKFLGTTLALCLTAYFAYHLVEGRRGLLALQRLDFQLARAQDRLEELAKEEQIFENRVTLLSGTICEDLLVERAKDVLGYVRPDEIVVVMNEKK